jgi:hypothetical protein
MAMDPITVTSMKSPMVHLEEISLVVLVQSTVNSKHVTPSTGTRKWRKWPFAITKIIVSSILTFSTRIHPSYSIPTHIHLHRIYRDSVIFKSIKTGLVFWEPWKEWLELSITSKKELVSVLNRIDTLGEHGFLHPHNAHFLPNADFVLVTWNPGHIEYFRRAAARRDGGHVATTLGEYKETRQSRYTNEATVVINIAIASLSFPR